MSIGTSSKTERLSLWGIEIWAKDGKPTYKFALNEWSAAVLVLRKIV